MYQNGIINTHGSKLHGGRKGILRPIVSRLSVAKQRRRRVRMLLRRFLSNNPLVGKKWWEDEHDLATVKKYFTDIHYSYLTELYDALRTKGVY